MGFKSCETPGNEYIDSFIIDQKGNFPATAGSLFRLFRKENQIFFSIDDSPPKEIYILKTWIRSYSQKFLVFENLRGHIRSEDFIENLTDRIFSKINRNSLPEKIMDEINFKENHHIKIPLNNEKQASLSE